MEWISNEVLLYSAGNYIQSLGVEHDGRGYEEKNIYIYICVCVCLYMCVCVCCSVPSKGRLIPIIRMGVVWFSLKTYTFLLKPSGLLSSIENSHVSHLSDHPLPWLLRICLHLPAPYMQSHSPGPSFSFRSPPSPWWSPSFKWLIVLSQACDTIFFIFSPAHPWPSRVLGTL